MPEMYWIFNWYIPDRLRYAWYMYTWLIPEIYHKNPWYTLNISKYTLDIPEKYPRYTRDIQSIYLRFTCYIHEIYLSIYLSKIYFWYAWNIPEIYLRYLWDVPEIIAEIYPRYKLREKGLWVSQSMSQSVSDSDYRIYWADASQLKNQMSLHCPFKRERRWKKVHFHLLLTGLQSRKGGGYYYDIQKLCNQMFKTVKEWMNICNYPGDKLSVLTCIRSSYM